MSKRTGGFIGQDGINAPDQATGVSAESLGISSQVNVSFTAPSDVGGAAITGYSVQSNNGDGTWQSFYDIENASYDSESFSVAGQSTAPVSIVFNDTGTKFFILQANGSVYQYSLSTAWDISTASYDSVSFDPTAQMTNPYALEFANSGSKMYIQDYYGPVYEYTLSTAFDLSTASYSSNSYDPTQITTQGYGIAFNLDGTKVYLASASEDSVFQYSLSTAYNISTASYDSKFLSVAGQDGTPYDITFSAGGTKLFVVGNNNDYVFQYNLTTAYDISTASYSSISFSVSSQEATPSALAFKSDGAKMYILGFTNDTVFQYTTAVLDYPTASPVTVYGLTNGTSYTFNVWAINAFGWSSPSDASGSASPCDSTRIEYVTIMSTGNSTDFGDLLYGGNAGASCSNSTRGVIALNNQMQYITIATTANALDFGDRTVNVYASAGCASPTRGLFAGGESSTNVIDYITIASTGNAIDFGNLTQSRGQLGSVSSDVRGVWGGGASGPSALNRIDYVTIASTGNATDFGDLTVSRYGLAAAGSNTRGIFGAGNSSGRTLDYVTIATTGFLHHGDSG